MQKIKVTLYNNDGQVPQYQTEFSAGMDLHAKLNVAIEIDPYKSAIIPTGIHIQIPHGYEAQIRSRSGLAAKNGIFVLNSPGTIDSDYTGELKIILFNAFDSSFAINPGDRIAQMVFAPIVHAEFSQVDNKGDLVITQRGDGGFGHTGIKLDT